jgi:hypothetical protein
MTVNEHTSAFYTEILQRIESVRRKEHRILFIYGLLATLLLSFGVVLISILLEEVFSFGTIVRTILFGAVVTGIASAAAWFVVRPLLRLFGIVSSEDRYRTALKIGEHFPSIRDRLLDALQMYEGREQLKQNYSLPLIDASFADLYEKIQPLEFTAVVSNQRVLKLRKMVLYTLAIVTLTCIASPSGFLGSLYRIVNFNQSFAAPLAIRLYIEPGNIDAVRGQTVPVTIRTEGKPVSALSFHTRQEGQIDFDAQAIKPNTDGSFHAQVANIKTSTEYFASVDEVSSDKFTIHVLDRPLVKSLQLTVTPPNYTRIPVKRLDENMGDVTAYPGSKITIQLTSSKELSSAVCVFNDSSKLQLASAGVSATATFTVKKNTSYHLLLKDHDGLPNLDPIEYIVKVIPDEYPTVEILDPAKNIDLTEAMKLDLFIRIKDDFGFSKLRLAYRLTQSKFEHPAENFSYIDIPLPATKEGLAELWHHWDLLSMNLVPEDAITYYVEVFDNDNINGPKSGKSETYTLRVPSFDELFSEVSQTQQQSVESMQNVAKETEQLKKEVEEVQREMKKSTQKSDWQQQKKAEQMLQRYEAMKKNLEQTSEKMEEMTKKMEDNKMLSEKTMEKYHEFQKLLDELKNPDLEKALKKLQESMKQPSPDQLKQAMEQLKNSEEQFRKNLERMVELLKRIHIEQKLDELIKRAEAMKKQQESLKQQASKPNSPDQQQREEMAQKQEDIQKQMEQLQKETADLKKKMEEFPKEMPTKEMSKAQEQMEQKQTEQKMKKSAQQMHSGDMQSAKQNQEQSEKDLDEDQQELENVQKSLQQNQMKQIVNEMKKQLENILELSKREEALKEESKTLDPNSQRFRENGEKQNDVKSDLNNVANAMSELGKKSFSVSPQMGKELGSAMNQMEDALAQTEGRNPGGTSGKQGEAMGSLNRAAMMMQNALNGMMNGGQGGAGMAGLMGRLGQMAGQQEGINGNTGNAMGMGQGQGLTPQQQAAYQRLAGEQSALKKSVEELSREAKNTGEFSKLLGDLDQVAKQMQEVQTDLAQNNVNPETIQKQDRILSRLLDASRSTRERDFEKRRKSESGKNIARTSPAEIDLSTQEGKNRLRQEMLKVLEGKYSKDYQELIRKYFEQLEKEEVKE